MQLDKTRVEQDEKRKTLAAETQQHQQVGNWEGENKIINFKSTDTIHIYTY